MTRTHIGLGVSALIAAMTGAVYMSVPSSLESRAKNEVRERVARAQAAMQRNAGLEAIVTARVAKDLAEKYEQPLVEALLVPAGSTDERFRISEAAFAQIRADKDPNAPNPSVLVVYDSTGKVAVREGQRIVTADEWTTGHKVITEVLSGAVVSSKDVWRYRNDEYMTVGVAPLFHDNKPFGALVVGYVLDNDSASRDAQRLNAEVAYFAGGQVRVSSLKNRDKDTHARLTAKLDSEGLMKKALESGRADKVVPIWLGDEQYYATATALNNHEDKTSGAVVMVSLTDEIRPFKKVRLAIGLLGLGALIIAVLAIFLTARSVLAPAEEIELGVTEIINGNIDYVFKPVGADFDGLANALNVMMSRLTGRPEPGEEEEGEGGESRASVMLDEVEEGAPKQATDQETLALAQESEPTYYARLFDEYTRARAASGAKDAVGFEGFVAKLRVNELNLIKKYNCRVVRFKVVTKDGQVTLKPVPIY